MRTMDIIETYFNWRME